MKRTKKPLVEVVEVTEYISAIDCANTELAKFIGFIRAHNPNLDKTAAVWTAAICLEHLPSLFTDNPQLMERLRAIASELSRP